MGDADPDLALSCPICMERYSDTRYPIASYCGHSICKECGDKRKSNQCVSCTEHCFYDGTNKTLPWPSNGWEKNFALLADSLKLESDLLTRFSEDCLPPLRKYRKVVTDSTSRLLLLKGEGNEGKIDVQKARFLKEESSTVSRWMVHCKRLPQTVSEDWFVSEGTDEIDRLNFTVSHPMTLLAIDMYGARDATKINGSFVISSTDGEILRQEYPLWHGTREYSTKVVLKRPVELSPQKTYLVEMHVGKTDALSVFYGEDGVSENNLPSGHLVTFTPFDGENNGTDHARGQFPGFYFSVNQL